VVIAGRADAPATTRLRRDRPTAEVVEEGIGHVEHPQPDLAALGVEEGMVGRVQRDTRDQRAVLVDLNCAVVERPRAQRVAIGEAGRLGQIQRPALGIQPYRREAQLAGPASYSTRIAPASVLLLSCTFSSSPSDGLFGSIVESVTKASWLVPNALFRTIGPPACTSSRLLAIL